MQLARKLSAFAGRQLGKASIFRQQYRLLVARERQLQPSCKAKRGRIRSVLGSPSLQHGRPPPPRFFYSFGFVAVLSLRQEHDCQSLENLNKSDISYGPWLFDTSLHRANQPSAETGHGKHYIASRVP